MKVNNTNIYFTYHARYVIISPKMHIFLQKYEDINRRDPFNYVYICRRRTDRNRESDRLQRHAQRKNIAKQCSVGGLRENLTNTETSPARAIEIIRLTVVYICNIQKLVLYLEICKCARTAFYSRFTARRDQRLSLTNMHNSGYSACEDKIRIGMYAIPPLFFFIIPPNSTNTPYISYLRQFVFFFRRRKPNDYNFLCAAHNSKSVPEVVITLFRCQEIKKYFIHEKENGNNNLTGLSNTRVLARLDIKKNLISSHIISLRRSKTIMHRSFSDELHLYYLIRRHISGEIKIYIS